MSYQASFLKDSLRLLAVKLSVETVCRSLTSLKKRGLIALSRPRSVRIIDRDALEEGGACDAYPKHLGARRGCDNLSAHSS
jgi:CRP/FNR family transcriptional regulator, nitrogen fixation regulation protein